MHRESVFLISCSMALHSLMSILMLRFMEEWKSQGEVNALRASLKTHASVKRDGVFAIIESSKVM